MSIKNSIKELEKQLKAMRATAAAEAAFKRMSKPQKRVAIAKDVIASIKAKQLVARAGHGYVYTEGSNKHEDFQSALAMGQQCTVCALGGIFTCAAKVLNEVSTDDAEFDQLEAYNYLHDIFAKEQLEQIEAAFEVSTDIPGFGRRYGDEAKKMFSDALKFGRRYDSDAGRMIAIMKNIIRNEGTFKP